MSIFRRQFGDEILKETLTTKGTYGCTRESCEFRDALQTSEVFKRTECEVVGVSSDGQVKQKKFVDENGLPYPVLCDTEQEARKLYMVGRGLMNMTEGKSNRPGLRAED